MATDTESSSCYEDKILDCEYDYRILIIGVTGAGKSTACNFFLDKEAFKAKKGAISITTKSEAHGGDILGKKVLFIDTPGFSDAYQSNEERINDLAKALLFARNGVHALGICFDGSRRYNEACEKTIEQLSQLGTFWPHAFILYTHAARMGKTEDERLGQIKQCIQQERCPKGLKDLLERVENRVITVESKNKDETYRVKYRDEKCEELLRLVNKIHDNNCRRLYDNEMFKVAKKNYDEVVQEKKKQKVNLQEVQKQLKEYIEKCDDMKVSLDNQSAEILQRQRAEVKRLQTLEADLQEKIRQSTYQQSIQGTKTDIKKNKFEEFVDFAIGAVCTAATTYVASHCSVM